MKRAAKLAVIALLLATAYAQEPPDTPQPQKTPAAFWLETGAYTASILADDWSTQRFERMGCVEGFNPTLYGLRPTNTRFLAVSFGIEAAEVYGARRAVRSRSKFWKTLGYSFLGYNIENRTQAVAHNLGLHCK